MALNEPNKPDDVKTAPASDKAAEVKEAPGNKPMENVVPPAPIKTTEEAAKGGESKPGPDDTVFQPGNIVPQKTAESQPEKQPAQEVPKTEGAKDAGQPAKEPEAPAPEKKPPQQGQTEKVDKPVVQADKPEKGAAAVNPVKTEKPTKGTIANKPEKPGRGQTVKASAQAGKQEKKPATEKSDKPGKVVNFGGMGGGKSQTAQAAPPKEQAPPVPAEPPKPTKAPRNGNGTEKIVYINISEIRPFKDHPFSVRDDAEMRSMVESVKDKGVTQPAIVRPTEDGGYEMVSGHRRQKASELAGYFEMPCIVRDLNDEQAITQMVEDNTNQRDEILPSERAKALKMQLDAIKRQGTRGDLGKDFGPDSSKRSNEIVAERNKMNYKQVQRYIKLNDLVPELLKMVDEKKITFTPALELAFIKPKNQQYIALAIEAQQSAPTLSQSQRMRELDGNNQLNPDIIDGIMLEDKKSKEVDQVIISAQELSKYFTKDRTPREMKDQIIKLLDDWAGKEKDLAKPEKKNEQEK